MFGHIFNYLPSILLITNSWLCGIRNLPSYKESIHVILPCVVLTLMWEQTNQSFFCSPVIFFPRSNGWVFERQAQASEGQSRTITVQSPTFWRIDEPSGLKCQLFWCRGEAWSFRGQAFFWSHKVFSSSFDLFSPLLGFILCRRALFWYSREDSDCNRTPFWCNRPALAGSPGFGGVVTRSDIQPANPELWRYFSLSRPVFY